MFPRAKLSGPSAGVRAVGREPWSLHARLGIGQAVVGHEVEVRRTATSRLLTFPVRKVRGPLGAEKASAFPNGKEAGSRSDAPGTRRIPPSARSNPLDTRRIPPARRRIPPAPRRIPPAPRRIPPAPRRIPPAPRRIPPTPRRIPPAPRRIPPTPRRIPPAPRRIPPPPRRPSPTPLLLPPGPLEKNPATELSGHPLSRAVEARGNTRANNRTVRGRLEVRPLAKGERNMSSNTKSPKNVEISLKQIKVALPNVLAGGKTMLFRQANQGLTVMGGLVDAALKPFTDADAAEVQRTQAVTAKRANEPVAAQLVEDIKKATSASFGESSEEFSALGFSPRKKATPMTAQEKQQKVNKMLQTKAARGELGKGAKKRKKSPPPTPPTTGSGK